MRYVVGVRTGAEDVPGGQLDRDLIDETAASGHAGWHDGDLTDDDILAGRGVVGWPVRPVGSGTGVCLSVTRIDHESDLAFCRGAFGLGGNELAGGSGLGRLFRIRPQTLTPVVPAGQLVAPDEGAHVGGFRSVRVQAPPVAGESGLLEEETGPTLMGSQGGHSPRFGANGPEGRSEKGEAIPAHRLGRSAVAGGLSTLGRVGLDRECISVHRACLSVTGGCRPRRGTCGSVFVAGTLTHWEDVERDHGSTTRPGRRAISRTGRRARQTRDPGSKEPPARPVRRPSTTTSSMGDPDSRRRSSWRGLTPATGGILTMCDPAGVGRTPRLQIPGRPGDRRTRSSTRPRSWPYAPRPKSGILLC